MRGKTSILTLRPTHYKIRSDSDNKIISEEALANADIIINKLSEKKSRYKLKNRQRVTSDLKTNLKSLENVDDDTSEIPTSTISSNRRQNLRSRHSSRGSRNRSSSNTNKQGNKFIITKGKKGVKSKNLKKIERYQVPLISGQDGGRIVPLSTKGKKSNIFVKQNKITHNPYPGKISLKKEISRNYKHSKSNSQTVANNSGKKFNEFHPKDVNNANNVYSSKKGLQLNNINHEQPVIVPNGVYDNDQNVVIFPKDFNTVKYSQSPFLNKLTNLKQRSKKKLITKETYNKGHKSRNSMFPKSYTYQRRENEVQYRHQMRQRSTEPEEEAKIATINDTKSSNPYTNINPYENDHSGPNPDLKDAPKKYSHPTSDKKKAITVPIKSNP